MAELGARIWEVFGHDIAYDFSRLDAAQDGFNGLQPLSSDEAAGLASFDDEFEVRFVYNSNAIEGSTLTIGETALVLDGEFVPDRPGRDYFAARGSADGMAYYKRALLEGRSLSEDLVKDIHERTALDSQPAARGLYRRHPVYLRGSQTVPANWVQVPSLMADLVSAWTVSRQHPAFKAAAFHAMFENIHPFGDGNGRAGRLLLNYMLEQAGYPPIALTAEHRGQYLKALEDWQVREHAEPLVALIDTALLRELTARTSSVMQTRLPVLTDDRAGFDSINPAVAITEAPTRPNTKARRGVNEAPPTGLEPVTL